MSDRPDPNRAVAAWDRIVAWLTEHAPPVAGRLNGPASETELAKLDSDLTAADPTFVHGVPADLAAVLRRHDGGRDAGVLPGGPDFDEYPFDLLPAADIAEERRLWMRAEAEHPMDEDDLAYAADESDPEVRRVGFDPAWLPFGEVGGNVLCLDFHPAEGGTVSQVISHNHENAGNRLLAPSLADYLKSAAEAFEGGRYVLEDGAYLVVVE